MIIEIKVWLIAIYGRHPRVVKTKHSQMRNKKNQTRLKSIKALTSL